MTNHKRSKGFSSQDIQNIALDVLAKMDVWIQKSLEENNLKPQDVFLTQTYLPKSIGMQYLLMREGTNDIIGEPFVVYANF